MKTKTNTISLKKLLTKKYVLGLIQKNNPELEIKEIKSIAPIKRHFGEDFEHFVAYYSAYNKEGKQIPIFASAHSDGTRKKTFKILRFVFRRQISAQEPLFYDKPTQAMFYIGIKGANLFSYIERQEDIEKILQDTAIKLAHFHGIEQGLQLTVKRFKISQKILDPTGVLKSDTKMPEQVAEIKKLFKSIKQLFKDLDIGKNQKYVIQGDFHPENIIISYNTKEVNIIDYTDVMISDFCQDLGSFLQQFRFMSKQYYPERKIAYYQDIFLKNYFSARKIRYNQNIKNRINLFKAWLALRSAIFYFLLTPQKGGGKPGVNFLIQQTKEFLNQIKIK